MVAAGETGTGKSWSAPSCLGRTAPGHAAYLTAYPLELSEGVGCKEPRLQLGIGILRQWAAHQIAQAAHCCLRQGTQGVVELHSVLRDAFEDALPSTMPNQASGFEDQKAGILR